MKIEIGDLVQCTETGRSGIVIDSKRGHFSMMLRVRWNLEDANWLESDEVQKVY